MAITSNVKQLLLFFSWIAAVVAFVAVAITVSVTLGGRAPVLNIGSGVELVASADRGTANVRTLLTKTGLEYTQADETVTLGVVTGVPTGVLPLYSSFQINYTDIWAVYRVTDGVDGNGVPVRVSTYLWNGAFTSTGTGYTTMTVLMPDDIYGDSTYGQETSPGLLVNNCNTFFNGVGAVSAFGNSGLVSSGSPDLWITITLDSPTGGGTGFFACTATAILPL